MRELKKSDLKNRLYIATVCGQHREILERYGIGVELDQFCTAEYMEGGKRDKADEEIRQLLRIAPRRTLHGPFNELFPAAIDPRAKALAFDRLESAAQLAIHYGADQMVVHSGYMPYVYFKEWHRDRSVEFWQRFMEDKPEGFKIVVENVLEDEPYMMAEMMAKIDNPNIRLCFDVGHAACISKVPVMEWLEVLAPYLGHLHLHNNDGDWDYHAPLMEGIIDMEAFLAAVTEKCSEDATIALETLDGLSSMEWLAELGYL